ncbi:MAG: hypothetical protein KAS53_10710 [Candidatus Cloacimonetes bacterium]|nr:hypothetical protein [Candidatus Cloacimonadota bacterium]
MKNIIKLFIILFILLNLISCSFGKLSVHKIQNIRKGMSPEIFKETTFGAEPMYVFNFEVENQNYTIHVYLINITTTAFNQLVNSMSSLLTISNNISFQTTFTPPTMNFPAQPWMGFTDGLNIDSISRFSAPYAFIYMDNKLFYWGYFEELLKHPDKLINELGSKTDKEYVRQEKMRNNRNFKG